MRDVNGRMAAANQNKPALTPIRHLHRFKWLQLYSALVVSFQGTLWIVRDSLLHSGAAKWWRIQSWLGSFQVFPPTWSVPVDEHKQSNGV